MEWHCNDARMMMLVRLCHMIKYVEHHQMGQLTPVLYPNLFSPNCNHTERCRNEWYWGWEWVPMSCSLIYTLSIMVCHMNDIGMALECEWEWAPMSCSLIYTFLNLIPDEWHKNGVRMRLRMSSYVLFPYIPSPKFNPIRMTSELHQNDGRKLFVMTPQWCNNEVGKDGLINISWIDRLG